MKKYFADFHIHVGINEAGKWVKIPTSRQLTLRNILHEAANRKGMEIIGIVDALSPLVREDLERLLTEGILELDNEGGYRYDNKLTLILGAEIETTELDGGTAHTLIFLPDKAQMESFAAVMQRYIRNINLSSQNAHMSLARLISIAADFDSLIVPAHVFTPHKSVYGACTDRLVNLLSDREISAVAAIELGLSSDTQLADRISELAAFSFLSNSDAHSPDKIAREYNIVALETPTFRELQYAFKYQKGREIAANFGLDPRLGKYHRTACNSCGYIAESDIVVSGQCPRCGGRKIVRGVMDRITMISDFDEPHHPVWRPTYKHQIPLSFIPGLGKAALTKLLDAFGTEMAVLHYAEEDKLGALVGAKLAKAIINVRKGEAVIQPGGGGVYGKMAKE
ncbi:MAG: hypothetical protein H6Q73_1340 [Firmicutes bacterium]|nr:hypothetical protein [Bacillota bacterium]